MIGIPFFAKNRPRLITTGGTITTLAWDKIHTFTTSGTFTCVGAGYIQLLVVGGGQGGNYGPYNAGSGSGNGGNGGEVKLYSIFKINSGSYTITIGGAGSPGKWNPAVGNVAGGDTSAFNITARGGKYNTIGNNGAPGCSDHNNGNGYNGAIGITSSISGSSYIYASSGGGGAHAVTGNVWTGGSGGTGAGKGGDTNYNAQAGGAASNYGAGGGGGANRTPSNQGADGGNGKAGVVIIRFRRI